MATATKNCRHQQTGWCDDCVSRLQGKLANAKDELAFLADIEQTNKNADALDAMLPEEGFDQRAPAGCKIEVVRYADPPECRVRVTLPGGTVEALDLRELPRRYAAMRAASQEAVPSRG